MKSPTDHCTQPCSALRPLPKVCHLCPPDPAPWLPPSPAPNGGTSGHYACRWGTPPSPRHSAAPSAPSRLAPEPSPNLAIVGIWSAFGSALP